MRKHVLVISASLRTGSNSELLADAFIKGARENGHLVEKLTLRDKALHFCNGCLACQKSRSGHCVIKDDADEIIAKMAAADVIVFATPVYFYEMCGQLKTLLDRTNPLFPLEYAFRTVYLITTAAEREKAAMDNVVKGMCGWIDCFEKASLQGVVYGTGVEQEHAVLKLSSHLQTAYEMGKTV